MTIAANTVWEIRTTGGNDHGGGFTWISLVNSTYKWVKSALGTNEYYCQTAAGGNPALTEPTSCTTDRTCRLDANGTLGSLTAGQWDWGDNDGLGYSTVYVRLDDGVDPDTKRDGWVQIGAYGGTDYSQQPDPQLTLANVTTDATGTILSTATAGSFTALMCGNCVYITGGGTTANWYCIIAYTSGTQVTIDRSCGANKNTVSINVGGSVKIGGSLDHEFWAAVNKTAGNDIYVQPGTYTLGETITAACAPTYTAPIRIIGYNTVRGDIPQGTDRPLINCTAAWIANFGINFLMLYNLRFTGASTSTFICYTCISVNCYFENISGNANKIAFSNAGNSAILFHCELVSTNGIAAQFADPDGLCVSCYIHDSAQGILYGGASGCVIANCTTAGMLLTSDAAFNDVHGNIFYNCGIGIKGQTEGSVTIINNIFHTCTTGLSWTNRAVFPFLDFNCFYNNTTDVTNVTKGPNDITDDPLLKSPVTGDFTLLANSPCFDAGMQLGSIVGL
jgi:hypothetical protein